MPACREGGYTPPYSEQICFAVQFAQAFFQLVGFDLVVSTLIQAAMWQIVSVHKPYLSIDEYYVEK